MAILATSHIGKMEVPGFPGGIFPARATREVSMEVAAWLMRRPKEFSVTFSGPEDLALRDASGKVNRLGYFGPVDARFGYGGAGISILRALTSLGIQAQVMAHYQNGHRVAHLGDLPEDARSQLGRRDFIPQLALVHCLPSDLVRCLTPRKVMWTMWETNRIPNGTKIDDPRWTALGNWTDHINQYAERLIVPCQHNAEVFAHCGVNKPIKVIPYGLDTEIWPYFERSARDAFTVVQYGDLSTRKGAEEGIQAFQRAFPTEQNVRLVLKTQGGILEPYVAKMYGKDRRISVYSNTWTRAQLVRLLHDADCFIWLSRGEGFGLPPLQAMLTGLPVVMTTHTGMAAYYNSLYFYGVRNAGMSDSPLGGKWYEPDVEHAAEQLRKVYDNRKTALKKAKNGAAYVRRDFSLEAFAGRLGTFLETL